MRTFRLSSAALLASTALLPVAANAAGIERNLFTWSGTVDREVIIEVRGRDVFTRGAGLDASTSPRLSMSQPLPRAIGLVHVRLDNGRGDVDVIENPSPRNNYTARLRVRDPRAGADRYRIVVSFETDGRGGYDGGYDNGRNGNGDWDRGRDNGRDNGRGNGRDGRNDDDRGGWGNNGRDNGDYGRGASEAGALRWSGVVDAVTEVRIQGRQVALTSVGQQARNVRYDLIGAPLPRHDVRLELAGSSGRGSIRVVQQPSAANGYTAVIRIEDRNSGAGAYDFNVRW